MPEINKRNKYLVKNNIQNTEQKEERKFNSKIKRHRVLIFYKIFGVLFVVAMISLLLYYQWKMKVYTDYEIKQEIEWSKSAETKCLDIQDAIFTYSKDGMACTDTKGRMIWNQTYEMQNPIVKTCENVMAVAEYNGREIYVASTDEILGKINTSMPIRDFCVATNGVVVAILDDSTITDIYLYNISGEKLVSFKTSMSKSGYPVAVDIAKDGKQVAVSYIKAEDGKVVSNIGFYNFSAVGQNYTDNLVGAYGYNDAVIPILSFMNHDTVFGLADHRLLFFEGKQKPANIADIWIHDDVQSVFYDRNYVGLVFYNASGETTYLLQVYDVKGNMVREIPFDMKCSDIKFGPEGVIIYNETECQIYDWDKLLKYQGVFYQKINCFMQTGKIGKYYLVTDNAIQSIQLQ